VPPPLFPFSSPLQTAPPLFPQDYIVTTSPPTKIDLFPSRELRAGDSSDCSIRPLSLEEHFVITGGIRHPPRDSPGTAAAADDSVLVVSHSGTSPDHVQANDYLPWSKRHPFQHHRTFPNLSPLFRKAPPMLQVRTFSWTS